MLPSEILEDIFAYLSRDALDHCEIICLNWHRLIETSKRLTQCRVVSLKYRDYYEPYYRFWMVLKSPQGKTFRIEDNPNKLYEIVGEKKHFIKVKKELPPFQVFKNIVIEKLEEYTKDGFIDFLELTWAKIFKLAGARIRVKNVYMEYADIIIKDKIMMKGFHVVLTKYIDVDELTMHVTSCTDFLHDRESWKYLDIGKKTEVNIDANFDYLPNNFPIDTFKEFVSGKYMEHPKLNKLTINANENDIIKIFSSIVEAFCSTAEPQKFFKIIKSHDEMLLLYGILLFKNFEEIVGALKFVNADLDPQKYLLAHPKLKWALEATRDDYYLTIKTIEL